MNKLKNPSGKKTITLSKNTSEKILVEDFESGSRNFDLKVIVLGENASVSVKGRSKSTENDEKRWKITVELTGKGQSAEIDLRGIADDNSTLEFDGSGVVGKNSQEGSILLDEKIILVSPNAKGKALPVLRVETENVASAAHSASIAPFGEEMFFYLESRGISRKQAKELLLEGFLQ